MTPVSGRIIEVFSEGSNRMGLVEFDGKRRAIYLSLVPDARIGDDVLFHAGFATERVQPSATQQPKHGQASGTGLENRKPDLENNGAYRLLSELNPRHLRTLIPLAQDKQFAAGQIIFPAGATSTFLHLIVSGDVGLEAISGDHSLEVQILHAGDAMGWSAFTGQGLTRFQARALSPVSTIAFLGRELRGACDRDPAMGYALMKRLMELATERLDAMRLKLTERALGQTADR
jgi:CRP/FNR family cyclic AMP-dependent transcriptional regulator